jgi:phosphatidylglycerol:prolipoprotein diacylglycerol transferase
MRKVLLRIVFDRFWGFQEAGNELHIGVGWLIIVWLALATGSATLLWRKRQSVREVGISIGFWAVVPVALLLIRKTGLPLVQSGIPIFGYGFMMVVGFSAATLLAVHHAKRIGMDPNIIWDLMMWLLIPGLIGARAFYVIQYPQRVFGGVPGQNPLRSMIALWDGGLVFYGSVIGGAIGGWIFCHRRKIRPLQLGDVVAPSLFVGAGFGRIGCFLYGCCYGGPCSLPWAVQFPPDSLTYQAQLNDGVILPGAQSTTPLHPTQIYSSLMAFLLAGVLVWCFRKRMFEGFVVGLMFTLYPVNRFFLELIRNDERGQLGTSLTISQLISIVLFISGISILVWLSRKNGSYEAPERTAQPG